jgi:photosystem II stability/assembly factor-like uncharacterized protein
MKTFYRLSIIIIFAASTVHSQSNWTTLATTTDHLNTVCFVDSLTGWVGGSNGGGLGDIRKTSDGGATWTAQPLPVTNAITRIIFLNSTAGFACGSNGTILKTTNGGQTWTQKTTGSTDNFTSIFFLNSQLGWACGWTTAVFTTDGGETWSSRATPESIANFDIAFRNPLEGLIVGEYDHCFKTADGGNTWLPITSPVGAYSYFRVQYLTPSRVVVAGGSRIALSTDAGQTWSSAYDAVDEQMNGVSFADSLTGWAASSGRIFKSIDGGSHWKPQTIPPGSGYLMTIQTPDGIHAWAISGQSILVNRPGTASSSHSLISANPVSIRADGKSTSLITVQIKDSEGTSFTSSAGIVELNTTTGTLGNVTDLNNGSYTALLTTDLSVGTATITGRLNGDLISGSATVNLLSAMPSLSRSTISASPATLIADGQRTATITVQIKYSDGANFSSSAGIVALKTTAGLLGPVTDLDNGSYTVTFTAPSASGAATITATLDGTPLTGSATIQLVTSGANLSLSTILVSSISTSVDHRATATMSVQIKDNNGKNYLTSAGTIVLRTTAGTLGNVTDLNNGSYSAVLTLSAVETKAIVTAELDGVPLLTSATVLNDWQTFPMEVGNKWFYKYYSNSLYGTTQKKGFVVRTITANSESDERTVSVTTEYTDGSNRSNEVEYWTYQNGRFFLKNTKYRSDDPIYIATLTNDSSAGWAAGKWSLVQKPYLGKNYNCQLYNYSFYWSGSGTAYQRTMAAGLGLVYLYNSSSFMTDGTRDSTVLVGAIINGVLTGDSTYTITTSIIKLGPVPMDFRLDQNYPNPFNPSTTISFSLPSQSFVTLKVFDVMGRDVATIISEELPAGVFSRSWSAEGMPSGVYFYRLQAGSFQETKRLLLVR